MSSRKSKILPEIAAVAPPSANSNNTAGTSSGEGKAAVAEAEVAAASEERKGGEGRKEEEDSGRKWSCSYWSNAAKHSGVWNVRIRKVDSGQYQFSLSGIYYNSGTGHSFYQFVVFEMRYHDVNIDHTMEDSLEGIRLPCHAYMGCTLLSKRGVISSNLSLSPFIPLLFRF